MDASQVLPELFGPTPVNIPKAPALGLLLDEPLFAIYNSDATVEERMELAIKKKEENDAKWAVKLAARREADTANEGATPTPNTASASSSSTENAVIWDSSNKDHGECQADEGVQVTPPSPAVTTADSSSAQVKVEELDGSSSSGSVIEDAQPDSTEVADHVEIKHEDKLKKEEQMESTSSPNKNNKDNSKNNSNNKGGKRKADKEIRIFESKRIKLGLEKIEFGNKELIEAFKLKHIHEFIVKKEHELNE